MRKLIFVLGLLSALLCGCADPVQIESPLQTSGEPTALPIPSSNPPTILGQWDFTGNEVPVKYGEPNDREWLYLPEFSCWSGRYRITWRHDAEVSDTGVPGIYPMWRNRENKWRDSIPDDEWSRLYDAFSSQEAGSFTVTTKPGVHQLLIRRASWAMTTHITIVELPGGDIDLPVRPLR